MRPPDNQIILRIFFFTNEKTVRKLLLAIAGASFLTCGAALYYVLPRTSTVQIVGVEVKRVDGESGSRDVYMIQTQDPRSGGVRVFRNEDALIYLKFDSADLQARAAALSRGEPPKTVAIRHYGWRIPLLSVFPNALSVREVGPDHRPSPLTTAGLALLVLLFAVPGALLWRRGRSRHGETPTMTAPHGEGDDHAAPGQDAPSDWLSTNRQTGPGPGRGRDA